MSRSVRALDRPGNDQKRRTITVGILHGSATFWSRAPASRSRTETRVRSEGRLSTGIPGRGAPARGRRPRPVEDLATVLALRRQRLEEEALLAVKRTRGRSYVVPCRRTFCAPLRQMAGLELSTNGRI